MEAKEKHIQSLWDKVVSSNASSTTEELLRKRSDDEKERLERLANPTFSSAVVSAKRAAALLATVLGE